MHKMKILWACLFVITNIFWTGITALHAQTAEKVITMDEAVDMALNTNFLVAIEDLNMDEKRRQRDMSWSYFLPSIKASSTFYKPHEPALPILDRYTLTTGLDFTLALNAQLVYGIRQTFLDYEKGVISRDTAKKNLEINVRKTFLSLIVLEETIKLTNKKIENAKTQYDQAKVNYRNGLVDEYTMLAAQVKLESLKPALMEIQNNYTNVMLTFKMLIGSGLDDKIKLQGSIEPDVIRLDMHKLMNAAMTGNPDILISKAELKMAENAKSLEISGFFPTLAFLLNYDPTFTNDPFKNSWFADVDNEWKEQSGGFALSISIPLDKLIPGSQSWQKIKNNEDTIQKGKLALKNKIQQTETNVRLAVLQLKKSEEAIRTYELNLKVAEKANTMGQQAYKAGLKDYSQIEETEVQLDQAQLDLLKEKYNYAAGLLDLTYTINTSLDKVKE